MFDRLDPELEQGLRRRPTFDLRDIDAARRRSWEIRRALDAPPDPDVERSDHVAHAPGGPEVRIRMFRPKHHHDVVPCVYWVPGGGYVLTSPDFDDAWCQDLVSRHACAAVAVEWRRAPEHPFPAAADDCYTGLRWVVEHAAELGIDGSRIVVAGNSSGGGSAAGLALLVRDRGEFEIAHQLLIYPMLDDSCTTASSQMVTDPRLWNREANGLAWRYYLGDAFGTDDVSPYAAPARMQDLAGAAPATILTGELDLFLDEDIEYARRLMQAGVSTELHVYRGAPHGFYGMNAEAGVSELFFADRDRVLERIFRP